MFIVTEGRPEVVAAFKAALEGAGSTSHEEFVIRFNVDILSPKVQHADEEVGVARVTQLEWTLNHVVTWSRVLWRTI